MLNENTKCCSYCHKSIEHSAFVPFLLNKVDVCDECSNLLHDKYYIKCSGRSVSFYSRKYAERVGMIDKGKKVLIQDIGHELPVQFCCPNCYKVIAISHSKEEVIAPKGANYCQYCGQKIDYSAFE